MKGFALNEKGDVVFERNDVKMVEGLELTIQKIRQILSTNKGEWQFNLKEGIPVQKILKKNPSTAQIKDCIRSAISQVDSTLEMTKCIITNQKRKIKISFSISCGEEKVETEVEV